MVTYNELRSSYSTRYGPIAGEYATKSDLDQWVQDTNSGYYGQTISGPYSPSPTHTDLSSPEYTRNDPLPLPVPETINVMASQPSGRTGVVNVERSILQDDGTFAIMSDQGNGLWAQKGKVGPGDPYYADAWAWAQAHPEAQYAATDVKRGEELGAAGYKKQSPLVGTPASDDVVAKMRDQPVPIVKMQYVTGGSPLDVAAVNPWTPQEYDPIRDPWDIPATDWYGAPIPDAFYDPKQKIVEWDLPGKDLMSFTRVGFFTENTTGRDLYTEVNQRKTPVSNPEDFMTSGSAFMTSGSTFEQNMLSANYGLPVSTFEPVGGGGPQIVGPWAEITKGVKKPGVYYDPVTDYEFGPVTSTLMGVSQGVNNLLGSAHDTIFGSDVAKALPGPIQAVGQGIWTGLSFLPSAAFAIPGTASSLVETGIGSLDTGSGASEEFWSLVGLRGPSGQSMARVLSPTDNSGRVGVPEDGPDRWIMDITSISTGIALGSASKGIVGRIRTAGKEFVPIEDIGVPPEAGYPTSAKITEASLTKSFKEGSLFPAPEKMKGGGTFLDTEVPPIPEHAFLPGEATDMPKMWTAWAKTPGKTGTETPIGKGSSEIPGMYGSPIVDSYFTKVKTGGQMAESGLGLDFKLFDRPSILRTTLKDLQAVPAKFRGNNEYGGLNEWIGANKEGGTAYMPLKKIEYEAVLPAGNIVKIADSGYYTKLGGIKVGSKGNRIGSTRVPIYDLEATGKMVDVDVETMTFGLGRGSKGGGEYYTGKYNFAPGGILGTMVSGTSRKDTSSVWRAPDLSSKSFSSISSSPRILKSISTSISGGRSGSSSLGSTSLKTSPLSYSTPSSPVGSKGSGSWTIPDLSSSISPPPSLRSSPSPSPSGSWTIPDLSSSISPSLRSSSPPSLRSSSPYPSPGKRSSTPPTPPTPNIPFPTLFNDDNIRKRKIGEDNEKKKKKKRKEGQRRWEWDYPVDKILQDLLGKKSRSSKPKTRTKKSKKR